MTAYLLKLLGIIGVAFTVIYTYYSKFTFHTETFGNYLPYLIFIISVYLIYKIKNYLLNKNELVFTPISILNYFLIHLFGLSCLFFFYNGGSIGAGLILFIKIIFYLVLPITISLISISFGRFCISKIPEITKETSIFQFLLSIGIGFFSFITVLTIFGFAGFYNFYTVLGILTVMAGISFKEGIGLIKSIFSYEIKISDHNYSGNNIFDKINFNLLSTELLFIVITFLLSVNFINIVRPMPIGWDDLGVYMNYPQLLANAGKIIPLGGILTWHTFTGIGFMLKSASQAFFLNNIGGVFSVIVIILSFYDLLKSESKKFLNIPMLAGAIFAAMPMVIFQQAKDQKLDPGLFFISAIVIYLVLYIFLKYVGSKSEKGKLDLFAQKKYLILLFIIGILSGFAFCIKVTSLLLISGLIGIFAFSKLGVAGLLSYFSFYIAIFTKAGLWGMMNVVYPKDNIDLINKIFLILSGVGICLLSYAIKKYSLKSFIRLLNILLIFLVGIFAGMSPWIVKNISTLDTISIGGIIGGKSDSFNVDYLKIYTKSELEAIKSKDLVFTMSTSGTTTNEDLGRYFGYEKGINNYLKLPYNLTMQSNQRGEYTDITFIFLALIPIIFIFLSYKNVYLILPVFAGTLGLGAFYFNPKFSQIISKILTNYSLPNGYIIIALVFLLPTLYLLYALNKERLSVLFKLNLIFVSFYVFLWTISAFGIVWYGIAMYYSLILMIAIGLHYISTYYETDGNKYKIIKFFGSIILFGIISTYFINSSLPHGLNNLTGASYESFKNGSTKAYTTIFSSQPKYFDILQELNINKGKEKDFINDILSKTTNTKLIEIIKANNIDNILKLRGALAELSNITQNQDLDAIALNTESKRLLDYLYENVLYPKAKFKNEVGVYRIGTFLRYFISDNYKRLFEDSMATEFNKYFYDEKNVDIGVERMKKMGVNYFLVDLNAATIDRDPRHDLTTRVENLLRTFTSDKLELVSTDSICLQIALEDYKKSKKTSTDLDNFIYSAGVNYESYTASGETINRGIKQLNCYNNILGMMRDNKIDQNNYSYLLPIVNFLKENKIEFQEQLIQFFRAYVSPGWLVLFRIK